MIRPMRLHRTDKRRHIYVSEGMHRVLSYYAQTEQISLTTAANSIFSDFLIRHYQIPEPDEIQKKLAELLIPSEESLAKSLSNKLTGKKTRRKPLHFAEGNIGPYMPNRE